MMPTRSQNETGDVNTLKGRRPGLTVRQCAVTRETLPPSEMVRYVLSPDGVVTPDLAASLPGRGVWVKAERACLEKAVRTNVFVRGFKAPARIADNLVNLVETLLVRRCQGILGIARKAGAVILGFDQVRAELQLRPPGWLLEASDGAEDGRNKVYFLAKALYETPRIAGALSASELGMALGRERVIHALLGKGPFANKWTVDYTRLTGFRKSLENDWFPDGDR